MNTEANEVNEVDEVNDRLKNRCYIFEYVRKPSTKQACGLVLAHMSTEGEIFITGSVCKSSDRFDANEGKKIALKRMDKTLKKGVSALPASLEDASLRLAERAVVYFKGGKLVRPIFHDYTPADVRKLLEKSNVNPD